MMTLACRARLGRRARLLAFALTGTALTAACSSSEGPGRGAGSGSNASAGPSTSGGSSGGTSGTTTAEASVNTASSGVGGSTTTGVASTTDAGPTTSNTSSGGGTTTTSASAGGASATTDGGTTGMAGTAGTGGNTSGLNGGASGAFVCQAGATYGDPFAGMGTVQEIGPAQGDFFAFIEGPVWVGSLGTLFFSDHSSPRRIFKLVPPSTTPEVFSADSASNGISIDNDDQLIVAEEQRERITRIDPLSSDPSVVDEANILVTGSFPNGPNDVIYRSDGNIYFTSPSEGFYRADPSGAVTGPITTTPSPNGVVLSPDENTLYVGSVGNQEIWSFPVDSAGVVDTGSGAVLANTVNPTLDGMAVDCAGNIYGGTSNGVEVFSPTGEALGIVPTGESSNVTFGGADRMTLYVTSRALLKSVTMGVPGLPD